MVQNPERALWAIHQLLLVGRALAYENAPTKDLAELFDYTEVLPLYILEERDATAAFRSLVEGVAEKFPRAKYALNGLDGVVEISSSLRGHLATSLKSTD